MNVCLEGQRDVLLKRMNGNTNVTVIPARYCAARQEKDEDKSKLRGAAYCRVSTDSEEQATSIPVLFEKENINTMNSKGEVLLAIMTMVSLAQQESQLLSQNMKFGLQFHY